MDVDTFKIRLTALPFLSKADVASYQQRVQQGRLSPETIFREAVRVNKQRKAKEIIKKKREFRFMIADIGLDFWDRRSLIRLIDENTVILRLKARADKLVKIREREDVGKRRARLAKFLTGLKIDRTEKDKLLERFDEGNSVKVLTQNAISLQKKKTSEAVSKDREFLKKAISRIGISSTLQAQLMSKFKPGKGAVQKLIEEAKRLNTAKQLQQARISYLQTIWSKDKDLKAAGFDLTNSNLNETLNAFKIQINHAASATKLLQNEALLTKKLYQFASNATKYGAFTRDRETNDSANSFLNHGNYLAYGLGATTLWVLGIPHSFAVMHGKTRRGALVFDVADLVKDALVLPWAFICATENATEQEFRQQCLQAFTKHNALSFMFDQVKEAALHNHADLA